MRRALKAVALGTALLMAITTAEAFTPSYWGGVRGRMAWKMKVKGAGALRFNALFTAAVLNVTAQMVILNLSGVTLTTPSGQEVPQTGTSLRYTTRKGTSKAAKYGTVPEGEYQDTNQWVADTLNAIAASGDSLTVRGKAVDPGDLGEFSVEDLDTGATAVKGSAKGIKRFANMKGSHKVKFAGTLASGPHAGKTFKGQVVVKYDNLE